MSARRWDHTRTSRIVFVGLWADAALVMAASAWNGGLAFEALGQHRAEGIALGVAVDVGLAVALIGDRALHLAARVSAWGRALRVTTAFMSLALNSGVQLWMGHYGVAAFHAFLPLLLVLLSEYAQDTTLQFGEIAEEHAAGVRAERDAQLKADREAREAEQVSARPTPAVTSLFTVNREVTEPIPAAVPPVFRAVPNRSAPGSAERPTDRPAGTARTGLPERSAERSSGSPRNGPPERSAAPARNGPARKQTGKPRSDADLSQAVRDLAQRTGSPPTQYQLKTQFGIGSARAARLLAELGERTPAAEPATNGTARKGGTA